MIKLYTVTITTVRLFDCYFLTESAKSVDFSYFRHATSRRNYVKDNSFTHRCCYTTLWNARNRLLQKKRTKRDI